MKLLIAIDGSSASLHALAHALQLTRDGLQVDFVLVNVQEPASLYEVVTAHDPDVIREVRGAAGADLLKDAQAMLDAEGLAFDCDVVGGDPAQMLVEAAQQHQCDAIVMGARGAGGLRHALLGTVVHAVLNASDIPVTVVRLPDEPEPESED